MIFEKKSIKVSKRRKFKKVQLQEGNNSNRFSIMERRLTGSKEEGSL